MTRARGERRIHGVFLGKQLNQCLALELLDGQSEIRQQNTRYAQENRGSANLIDV